MALAAAARPNASGAAGLATETCNPDPGGAPPTSPCSRWASLTSNHPVHPRWKHLPDVGRQEGEARCGEADVSARSLGRRLGGKLCRRAYNCPGKPARGFGEATSGGLALQDLAPELLLPPHHAVTLADLRDCEVRGARARQPAHSRFPPPLSPNAPAHPVSGLLLASVSGYRFSVLTVTLSRAGGKWPSRVPCGRTKLAASELGGVGVRRRGAGRGAEELLSESKFVDSRRSSNWSRGGREAEPIVPPFPCLLFRTGVRLL